MAKIISRKAYTHADKMRAKSQTQLLNVLMQPGDTDKIKKDKSNAYKLLRILYGLSDEDIKNRMTDKLQKRQRIADINAYYGGRKTAAEVAKKWEKFGYTPEKVHQAAMYLNRAEIPTMEVKHTRGIPSPEIFRTKDNVLVSTGKRVAPSTTSSISKLTQQPLFASGPVWMKTLQMADAVKSGTITKRQFIDYLLDVADRRPEFSAYIANLLVDENNLNSFIYKRSGERKQVIVTGKFSGESFPIMAHVLPKEKYTFVGKSGRELKDKFLDLITERRMLEYKQRPIHEMLKEIPSAEEKARRMEEDLKAEKEYKAKKYEKFNQDVLGKSDEFMESERRKKKRKTKVKRIKRKVIRRKPVIRKRKPIASKRKCRCK